MSATTVTLREFVCPGQSYAVSRAVHLARVASGYAACRDCPCNDRGDANGAPSPPVSRFRRMLRRDGLRGVFRNELTLTDVERLATAFANTLWEDAEVTGAGIPPRGFPVVVGHDDRPWSMPVAVAAGGALRQAGCETIDVGYVTGPAFRFAVSHLDAVAGLLATGAGGDASIAGLDFVGSAGRPLSVGAGLERLHNDPVGRITRRGGGRREFDANFPYEASLVRHFQESLATPIVVGTASPLLHQRLQRVGRELATSFSAILLPREADAEDGPAARAIRLTASAMQVSDARLGVWIDEGGSVARVFDNRGRLLPVEDVAAELIQHAISDRPRGTIAIDWKLADALSESVLRGKEIVRSGGTAEAMAITMADHAAALGVDSAGRTWLPGPPVACDALVMLARVLKAFANREQL